MTLPTDFNSFSGLLKELSANVFKELNTNKDDYMAFGLKNSVAYQQIFMSVTKDMNLTAEDRTAIIALACLCKNKNRIVSALKNNPKISAKSWANKATEFYKTKATQYTREAEAGYTKMPVVNIPGAFPFVAALVWKAVTPNPTAAGFVKNTWAAQIKLDDDLLKAQKTWEVDFWNNVITKSNAKDGGYEKGFQSSYWETKSKDMYALIQPDLKEFKPAVGNVYSEADITAYLNLPFQ